MQRIVGSAVHILTNPFASAGALINDPVASLNAAVGLGLTSLSDMLNLMMEVATDAQVTAKTNLPGYSLAFVLLVWIFYTGFRRPLSLDLYLPFSLMGNRSSF